jgi:transcriptional regulator with XRE-family HTH domain
MGLLRVIRLWALRKKMPIREIARRTGLSRNTIKKYLRAGFVEPQFQSLDRPSKLDPFAEKLSGWLVTEQRKSRKQRRTAKQMHADLVQLGFDGSYERVAAFVREWKRGTAARDPDYRSRNICAAGVSTGRGIPVRLERGLGSCRWRTDQVAGRTYKAVVQPRVYDQGVSAANA